MLIYFCWLPLIRVQVCIRKFCFRCYYHYICIFFLCILSLTIWLFTAPSFLPNHSDFSVNVDFTPPAASTHFHQDGHGTVDSGHLCLSGFNEVIMLRRVSVDFCYCDLLWFLLALALMSSKYVDATTHVLASICIEFSVHLLHRCPKRTSTTLYPF